LLAEFYWTWYDDQNKQNYRTFSKKLQEENKHLLISWRVFNGSLPKAYPCPFIGSCEVRQAHIDSHIPVQKLLHNINYKSTCMDKAHENIKRNTKMRIVKKEDRKKERKRIHNC
jgi:hypothetical protein